MATSSIPFSSSTDCDQSIPTDSLRNKTKSQNRSYSSSIPNHQYHHQPKKKESILHKLSISSRRSITWLSNNITTSNNNNNNNNTPPSPPFTNKLKPFSKSSSSSINQNNNNNNNDDDDHHHHNSIGKSMKNVARSIKKSLHQLDRPRSTNSNETDHDQNQRDAATRARAVSTSEVYNHQPNKASKRPIRSLNPSSSSSSSSSNQQDQAFPLPPKRSNKLNKSRPQSAFEPKSISNPLEANNPRHSARLSWHATTSMGSLPMAATILAAPPPPPIDHSAFLAIIPGQDTLVNNNKSSLPSLTVIPPPTSQHVDQPILTAASMKVEPAQSRRTSVSSSNPPQNEAHGFTFIRTPSNQKLTSPSPPASPNLTNDGLLSSSWTEIMDPSITTAMIGRPPLVSVSTTVSLVPSCAAERGSNSEMDELLEELENSPNSPHSNSSENDHSKTEKRKRTDSSQIIKEGGMDNRVHKVQRSGDEGFSHSPTIGKAFNHETSNPMSILTAGLAKNPSQDPSGAQRSNSSKRPKNPVVGKSRNRNHPPANELWNFSIVSTVVGVVILAAVIIGSTNLTSSSLNGKSWIGKLIKK